MDFLLGIGSRVKHEDFGAGVVIGVKSDGYIVTFMEYGNKVLPIHYPFEIKHKTQLDGDLVSLFDVERTITKILEKWTDIKPVPIGDKWKGGKLILQPGRAGVQGKEVPLDTFFGKIIMMRDRLRTLEQRVNASNMEQEEKITIQQYITRCYGSMTTFNVLFADSDDYFVGEKS